MNGFWKGFGQVCARFCLKLAQNLLFAFAGLLVFVLVCWLYWRPAPLPNPVGVEGTIRIEGDSMLPYLSGGAYLETCQHCGYRGLFSREGAGVCPNCRWVTPEKVRWTEDFGKAVQREQVFDEVVAEPSQKREVEPNGASEGSLPWQLDDCVCFADAEHGVCVKRVAACPGDTLEIRDGQRFVNGQRPLRSLETLRQVRILVHDDRFRPEGVSRWVKTESETETLWEYHHAEGRLTTTENGVRCEYVPALVTNALAQNGTQMRSDQIFQMAELMLECTLKYTDGEGELRVVLPTAQFTVSAGQLRECPDARWCFSTLDGMPRVWRDGELVEVPTTGGQVESPQMAVSRTLNVLVTDRVLFRDEYLLLPGGSQGESLKIDCGEGWFLLGDNTLASRDSRYWGPVKLTSQNAWKVRKMRVTASE